MTDYIGKAMRGRVQVGPRIRKPRGKVLGLMKEYAKNEAFLEANDKLVQRALMQRQKLAAQVVKAWGDKPLSFDGARYVPSTVLGKVVLRKFGVLQGQKK